MDSKDNKHSVIVLSAIIILFAGIAPAENTPLKVGDTAPEVKGVFWIHGREPNTQARRFRMIMSCNSTVGGRIYPDILKAVSEAFPNDLEAIHIFKEVNFGVVYLKKVEKKSAPGHFNDSSIGNAIVGMVSPVYYKKLGLKEKETGVTFLLDPNNVIVWKGASSTINRSIIQGFLNQEASPLYLEYESDFDELAKNHVAGITRLIESRKLYANLKSTLKNSTGTNQIEKLLATIKDAAMKDVKKALTLKDDGKLFDAYRIFDRLHTDFKGEKWLSDTANVYKELKKNKSVKLEIRAWKEYASLANDVKTKNLYENADKSKRVVRKLQSLIKKYPGTAGSKHAAKLIKTLAG